MDSSEFRRRGKEMVDYIADYLENIHTRRVLPEVQPGYLREMLPSQAPKRGEHWDDIFKDIERAIMPGVNYCFGTFLPPANEVWGKVIFSQACVKNSVHRGGVPGPGVSAPGGWSGGVPSGDLPGRLLLWVLHILLECILVASYMEDRFLKHVRGNELREV